MVRLQKEENGRQMTRVLIVDDEKNVLTTLSIGLKRHKYEVVKAQSGPEALALLEKQMCDIVLSDIRMKPMDGYTLAKKIREKYSGVRIILMSAYDMDEEQHKKIEKLSCSRLIKPFSVPELIKVIKREERKGEKGRVMVLADVEDRNFIRHIIESVGFTMDVIDIKANVARQIQAQECRLFIIDGESLTKNNFQMLNVIDRLAPQSHVILLAQKGDKRVTKTSESNLTILDKDIFCSDNRWAENRIRNILGTG